MFTVTVTEHIQIKGNPYRVFSREVLEKESGCRFKNIFVRHSLAKPRQLS